MSKTRTSQTKTQREVHVDHKRPTRFAIVDCQIETPYKVVRIVKDNLAYSTACKQYERI